MQIPFKKFVTRIGARSWSDPTGDFQELPLSKGTGQIELSSKIDDSGHYWTIKVTASLLEDIEVLHEPCVFCVWLMDTYYIIGTGDMPVMPTVKEGVLVGLTIEHKSKTKPAVTQTANEKQQ